MELIRKNIHMEHCLKLASTQISLEEDQNISDRKPDALQIVCKKTDIKTEEIKIQEDSIFIRGQLLYSILYLTDEKEQRLCNLEGEMPFEEKIYIEKKVSKEGVRVKTSVEDVTLRLINSRKINIRCVVAVSVLYEELFDEVVITDVDEGNFCEIYKKPIEVTTIVLDSKDIYRIKEEFPIPDGLPNIYNMLWKNIRFSGMNFIPMNGRIGVQGEWTAFFMYEGEEDEIRTRFFEVSRPFSGIIEVSDCREDMILCADYESEIPVLEVRSDYDGEERLIGLDIELKLFFKLYQNEILPIVTDAYGLDKPMEPIVKESSCERNIKRDSGRIKLSDVWELKEENDTEMEILHIDGKIMDERIEIHRDEALMQGVVHLDVLCLMEREESPFRCISVDIPYRQVINVKGADEECSYFGKVYMEQLTANILNGRMEMRVSLVYQLNISQRTREPLLVGMESVLEKDTEDKLPVMAVYFANGKEDIWEVGKKYQVSLNEIRRINQLNTDDLSQGQRVLVVRGKWQ